MCPFWRRSLVRLPFFSGGATTARAYDLLSIPHSEARVSLDYFVFDSWDGERA